MGCLEVLANINYLAVAAATVIAFGLGGLWYAPGFFGKAWMSGLGLDPANIDKSAATKGLIISAFTTFIEILVLACIVFMANMKGFWPGVHAGGLIGVGIISMVLLSNSIYEQKPFKVWLINAGYRATYFLICGGILGAWQ